MEPLRSFSLSRDRRDGKTLQNSTRKTLSLKNEHTKYVEKMPKIIQTFCKKSKNAQQRPKPLKKTWKKNSRAVKN